MRMGIEIETICGSEPINGIGDYHDCDHAVDELHNYEGSVWTAQSDSSIHGSSSEHGIEFVSPVFELNADNIKKVWCDVVDIRDEFGARTNRSCGVHISVSVPSMNPQTYRRLNWLARTWQQAMYASTGSTNRQTCDYARPLRNIPYTGNDAIAEGDFGCEERTSWINLIHINKHCKYTEHGERLEYRVFSGSTNPLRIITWMQLCNALTNHFLGSVGNDCLFPIDKPKDVGEGRFQMDCLLKTLGWTLPCGKVQDSNKLHSMRWVNNESVSLDEAVTHLQALATTYDIKQGEGNRGRGVL